MRSMERRRKGAIIRQASSSSSSSSFPSMRCNSSRNQSQASINYRGSTILSRAASVAFLMVSLFPSSTTNNPVLFAAAAEASTTTAQSAPNAGKLRASADTAFAEGKLEDAVKFLSQAIQIEPENEKNHYKRYRAYLRVKRYKEALQDLSSSISLDPESGSKIQQRAKLFRMMGRCNDAVEDLLTLQQGGAGEEQPEGFEEAWQCKASLEEAERLIQQQDWANARAHLDVAVSHTEVAPDLLFRRGYCSYQMRDFYSAAADTGRAIKLDGSNIPALELRGMAYYHLGEFDMAMTHFREGLKFDPEHKGCKDGHRKVKKMQKTADKGQAAVDVGSLDEGINHFRNAVAVDPDHALFNGPILVKIARAHVQLKQWNEAKEAINQALDMHNGLGEAYIVKSDILLATEDYDEAVRLLQQAQERFQGDDGIDDALKRAEIALKQSKEINYYKVLGVDRRADTAEIKRAYRTLAKLYHPDKQAESSPEEKEKAEKEFLKVAQAYEILSNDDLRAKYDRGEDVSGQAQPQGHGHNPFGHFPGGGQQHFTFRFH